MPYWRLSSFYLFYFASLGALLPFWGVYLQDQGFTALAIGQLMAILQATKIVAPNVWGWLADRTGRTLSIIRLASLLTWLAFLGIFAVQGFWGTALVMMVFSFFWNASLPQMEVVTINHLGARMRRYAGIRLWGSVGFILAVTVLGVLVQRQGSGVVPLMALALQVGIWITSLLVVERPVESRPAAEGISILSLARRPEVAAFLLCGFFMQISHGVYYAFYSIYLTETGYASGTIGAFWAWGVVVEVLVFAIMHHLLERFGARRVLLTSLGLAVVRWLLIGAFVTEPVILILAQALHAATFGAFHAGAIHLTHHYFTGRLQGQGQALFGSLVYGAGGAVGSLGSGLLWSTAGPQATFVASSLVAALGFTIAWLWVDRERRF
ncbi:MAG: MFS transporter [Chromatiaceae bacterium]|nr:MFS transporter [Chromatiaceae bacterium]